MFVLFYNMTLIKRFLSLRYRCKW